jgi:precorrin-6B C5,15-methyltransferase / cobalt-precorrin-6B C5,C15-methyltransferase
VASARVLAGGRRQLGFFPDWLGERIVLDNDVPAFVAAVGTRYRREKTVVLATGDPLFYGIGRALLETIPKEDLLFLPHVSSVQLAFARIKTAWEDARVVSLHGRPLQSLVPAIAARYGKIAVLTDAKNDPAAIAGLLRELGASCYYALWVCENLGGPDERVRCFSPDKLREISFSPLNVVILVTQEPPEQEISIADNAKWALPLLGIPDAEFRHQAGPHVTWSCATAM